MVGLLVSAAFLMALFLFGGLVLVGALDGYVSADRICAIVDTAACAAYLDTPLWHVVPPAAVRAVGRTLTRSPNPGSICPSSRT
jgi:hypothetical protein